MRARGLVPALARLGSHFCGRIVAVAQREIESQLGSISQEPHRCASFWFVRLLMLRHLSTACLGEDTSLPPSIETQPRMVDSDP